MSTHQPDSFYGGKGPENDNQGVIFGRQILLLALVCVAGVVLYKFFFNGDSDLLGFLSPSKEIKLTYVPSDFQPHLDDQTTLRILSNPSEYKQEFDDLVYNFNLSLLYHVAKRMNLADSLKQRLEPEYKKHHQYLAGLYFSDFVALKDTTANLYENWYNDQANQSVRVFNEVAGKYTCFFVTQVMATLLNASGGKLMARGKNVDTPCGIATNEGLKPMMERLQKKASIMDFSASRGLLKEKVRRGIAELATYEYQSKLGMDKTLQYKVLGYSISETDLRVEAISVVKAGFKLDRYFDVTLNPRKNTVYVTLPEPMILSHEVYPRVDKLDVGLLSGISGEEMNANFNELRRTFRKEAIEDEKVLDKARLRADSVLQLLIGPMVSSLNPRYKIEIRYQQTATKPDETSLRREGKEEPVKAKKEPFIPQ